MGISAEICTLLLWAKSITIEAHGRFPDVPDISFGKVDTNVSSMGKDFQG